MIPKDSNFCKGCGAHLNGSEKLFEAGESKTSQEKKSAKHIKQPGENKSKQISTMQIVYVVLALIVVGVIVLYASGALDSSPQPALVQNENQASGDSKLGSIMDINQQEELVKKNPGDLDNLLKLAHMLNDAGFYEKAIERYKQYLKSRPNEADVIVDMGVCYFQTGKYENAVANFKKGIEINPKHQIAHMNLGVVYNFGLNNKTEAIKWWKKAVELDPASEVGKKAQDFLNQNK